jgi:hypothetical protein
MMSITVSVIFFLFAIVNSEVNVKNYAAIIGSKAVLECTTSETGYLLWRRLGGENRFYVQPNNISLTPLTIDSIFEIRLIEIGTNISGRILKSTAATIDPITDSVEGLSLICSDQPLGSGNELTASVVNDTLQPINVQITDTSLTNISISWSHPDDEIGSVTGYYINHTSDGISQIIPLPSTNTNATIPVIPRTNNTFTVIATNGLTNRSSDDSDQSSSKSDLDAFEPEIIKFIQSVNFGDPNLPNITNDGTLIVSWEYTPNRPPIISQSLSLDGIRNVSVPISNRSWSFIGIDENETNVISLTAANVIGNTIKVDSYIPPLNITDVMFKDKPYIPFYIILIIILLAIAFVVAILISIALCVIICCNRKNKKPQNNNIKLREGGNDETKI